MDLEGEDKIVSVALVEAANGDEPPMGSTDSTQMGSTDSPDTDSGEKE
jgi:hypothetical protein